MSLTVYQLKTYANKWLKETYGFELEIPLSINGRLRSTYGRFKYRQWANGMQKPLSVEMNKTFVENNDSLVVLDVLKHELVHYAMFKLNKPFSDGHPIFERELSRLSVINQRNINRQYDIKSKKHFYKCMDCNEEYQTKTALRNGHQNYRCSCGGHLKDLGKKLVTT